MKKNENVDVEEKEKTPKKSTETKSKRSTTNETAKKEVKAEKSSKKETAKKEVKAEKSSKKETAKKEVKAEKENKEESTKSTKKATKNVINNDEEKEKVVNILKTAKEKGKITYGELAAELGEAGPEEIDKVFDAFEEMGINILKDDDDLLEPDIDELSEVEDIKLDELDVSNIDRKSVV